MICEESVTVEKEAGGYVARYNHRLLGFIEGYGPTEAIALAKWRDHLREVVAHESSKRYMDLRARHPEFNWSVGI